MARNDKDTDKLAGDVLGLGGGAPSAGGEGSDRTSSTTHTDKARRQRRMNEGADEVTPGTADVHRSSGATGIDMGAGGEGTDLE